ncbi:MAG: 2-deoxyribose-5-phosphate aldolase, partial [Bacteroidota bacterium]
MTEPELVKLCEISKEIKVDFVKTSTGFNGEGATVEAVKFLRKHLPKSIKIKASGGIRERAFAEALVQAGAERIGTSSGVLIIQ